MVKIGTFVTAKLVSKEPETVQGVLIAKSGNRLSVQGMLDTYTCETGATEVPYTNLWGEAKLHTHTVRAKLGLPAAY